MKRLSNPEVTTLYTKLKLSHDPRDIFTQVLLETGSRISEIIPFTTGDLDGLSLSIKSLKGSNNRRITISPNLEAKLRSLPDSGFTRSRSLKTNRTYYYRYVKGLGFNPHMLRHTALSRLYAATKDLLMVKEWAGHRSLASTMKYMHLDLADQANEAMSAILGS